MNRRVWGIETEYGITCAATRPGPSPLDADHAARELFRAVIEHERSTNVFLGNGARLYLDVGSHPEYATAECDRLGDLLAQDSAGAALLADLAAQANTRMEAQEVPGRLHLFKNNVDSAGHSCGCHENYLLHRSARFRDMADALVSFFIARIVLVGAGRVCPDGSYAFSQRAEYIDDAVSSATTRTRPIINTRDEPLAHAKDYRRLHVIIGDSNMAQGSTLLKVGMTHLLLGALEDGLDISDLAFREPLQTLRAISTDLDARARYELTSGKTMSACELLEEIATRIDGASTWDDPLADDVWDLWRRGMAAVSSGDWSGVDTELDFAIKKRLLDQAASRAGHLDHDHQLRLELAYHDITASGLAPALERAGRMRTFVDAQAVDQAQQTPPATTRAALRGAVIQAAKTHHREAICDWLHVRLNDSRLPTVTLGEPLATSDPGIDAILGEIEQG